MIEIYQTLVKKKENKVHVQMYNIKMYGVHSTE